MPKRKAIDLSTKVQIIERIEAGEKQAKVCGDYELSKQTVSTIFSNKQKIKEAFEQNRLVDTRKKIRSATYSDIDEAMEKWYTQVRAKGLPVSGPLLIEKPKRFAELLKVDDFKASQGWIDKFKTRHGLKCKVLAGEAESVSDATVQNWTDDVLPKHLEGWQAKNVFNCDESGLFWKMLPNRTLARKGEECHGAKKSKERVTLMFCSNADGSEKYPLAVIGKFKNPRCFKNVTNMPVHYYAQKNAWMDRYIFKQWLEAFDKKITKQRRNVLLFYDNVGSHIIDDVSLRSTTIVTLPPNTTSRLQPMDQGIIEACKKRYRSRLLQRVVVDLKAGTETKISLLDAIHLISRAWNDVTEKSIVNCYRKAGFKFDTVVEDEPTEDTADRIAEDRNVWDFISKHLNVSADQTLTAEDYVNCDENLSVDDTEFRKQK